MEALVSVVCVVAVVSVVYVVCVVAVLAIVTVVSRRPGLCFSDLGCVFQTSVVFFRPPFCF